MSTPLHLRLSLSQLADLQPTEDATRQARQRYQQQQADDETRGAASPATTSANAGPSTVAASAVSPLSSWLPARVSSKEALESAVQLVQSKMHQLFLAAWAAEQARQAAA